MRMQALLLPSTLERETQGALSYPFVHAIERPSPPFIQFGNQRRRVRKDDPCMVAETRFQLAR